MPFPPLAFFCTRALAKVTDRISVDRQIQCPLNELIDEHDEHDPSLWATIAQVVHPLPAHFHHIDIPLSHPHLPLLQRIADTPNFSLITLLSLPNCNQLRDDSIPQIASLNHLVALELRGTSISPYALTVLARALNTSTRTGPWGLRLLSLHSCPSINNDVLPVLQNFPLLSAIDLRFTDCSPALVKTHFTPLGFSPAENKSLFHPAPLFLALCALENIANSTSPPISLYSSPLPSVFRIHIDALHQPSHPPKRTVYRPSTGAQALIRTTSFAGDTGTVTFIPPVRKSVNKRNSLHSPSSMTNQDVDLMSTRVTRPNAASSPPGQPVNDIPDGREMRDYSVQRRSLQVSSINSQDDASDANAPCAVGYRDQARDLHPSGYLTSLGPAAPTPPTQSTDQVTQPDLFCDVSSFYQAPRTNRSRNRILPLSAQAIYSLEDGRLEPLAIVRSPPPWSILESYDHQSSSSKAQSDRSRKTQPARSLDEPPKVDRARLRKRNVTAVADMVNKLTAKRPKVESEFARVKAQERLPVKLRNPFTRSVTSVFAESTASPSDQHRCSAQGSSVEAGPEMLQQPSDLFPTKGRENNSLTKPLKPITTLKPPTLPKKLLVPQPKPPSPKAELRQTRLAFTRDRSESSHSTHSNMGGREPQAKPSAEQRG